MEHHIVKTYQFGKTTVHICNEHFAKTKEDKESVLKEYHAAGWVIVDDLVKKGEKV